jgi:hypothetical protein
VRRVHPSWPLLPPFSGRVVTRHHLSPSVAAVLCGSLPHSAYVDANDLNRLVITSGFDCVFRSGRDTERTLSLLSFPSSIVPL